MVICNCAGKGKYGCTLEHRVEVCPHKIPHEPTAGGVEPPCPIPMSCVEIVGSLVKCVEVEP